MGSLIASIRHRLGLWRQHTHGNRCAKRPTELCNIVYEPQLQALGLSVGAKYSDLGSLYCFRKFTISLLFCFFAVTPLWIFQLNDQLTLILCFAIEFLLTRFNLCIAFCSVYLIFTHLKEKKTFEEIH